MFEKFVTDRLTEGKLSVWDALPKPKLKAFKSASVTVEVSSGEKLVKVKGECIRNLNLDLFLIPYLPLMERCFWPMTKEKIVLHLDCLTGINQNENQTQNLAGESTVYDLCDTSAIL